MAGNELRDALLALLDFSDWVDARVWRCVEHLTTGQFTQPLSYSVGSIRDQLGHMLGAELVWLARMRGEATPADWRNYARYPDAASVRQAAREARVAQREYVAGLSSAALREYYDWPQEPGRDAPLCPRWLTLLHVINHGTDHRAQVLLQLDRHFGTPTCEIDLGFYWLRRRDSRCGSISAALIRRLFAYQRWAMAKIWKFVGALTEEQWARPLEYSVGSIQNQLTHLLNVERYWLRRLGAPAPPFLQLAAAPAPQRLQAIAAEQERWLPAWLARRSDLDMARPLALLPPGAGARLHMAAWQVLLHAHNHATEHRAQILAQLAQEFEVDTGPQDLIYYWWEVGAKGPRGSP